MIKNDKQLAITKERVAAFEKAVSDLDTSQETLSPVLFRLQRKALEGELVAMQNEIEEYTNLKAGNLIIAENLTIDKVYQVLIKARIAQGISQAQLAEKVNSTQQQIQRYESTNYETASLSTIINIAHALSINLKLERVLFLKPTFDLPDNLTEDVVEKEQLKIKEAGSLLIL